MNRKEFIKTLACTAATSVITPYKSFSSEEPFQDIRIDRYYIHNCNHSLNWWMSGVDLLHELIVAFRYEDTCLNLDTAMESFINKNSCFEVTDYFSKEYKKYDNIYITRKWVDEFWRRHKNDDLVKIRQDYLVLVNKKRKQNGLEPLNISEECKKYAKWLNTNTSAYSVINNKNRV